ncbi:hypothetical protein [Luteimonas salinilitoris]|uniref:Uncharacterized protein n=1 Tax=Luteimonas salinilitoris TaxID=3237697 RepID=A0ABV4HVV2_9GAMM
MPRVYQCIEWNDTTQQCDVAAWIEQASILDVLPTVEQANTVGGAFFASIVAIAALSLLIPRSQDHE